MYRGGNSAEAVPKKGKLSGRREGAFLGLRGKIILLYIAATLFMATAVVTLAVISLTDAFNKEYQDRALAIVRTFDAQYGSLAEVQDSRITQARIDRLMALNPDIYRISLYVPEGNKVIRIASSDKSQIGEDAEEDDAAPIQTGRTVFDEQVDEGEKVVEVTAPVHIDGRPVGSIGVYMRLAPRDQAVRGQAIRFAAIGVGAGLLLLLVLYVFLNWLLLRPISILKHSAKAIERGWLHTRITLKRSDELGELADAFNGMIDTLEKRDKENQELQQRLRQQYDQAQTMAITDPVTGLYNHLYFQDRLANELERSNRFGMPVALLFGDIDHFKVLNDSFGHQFGDRVLREMADILKNTVREVDIVARYGGEEFAVILPGTDAQGGQYIAERIRRAIAEHNFFGNNPNLRQEITISIGVAAYPEDGRSREDLVWKADRSMYYAKRLGRNQVRTYGELTEIRESEPQNVDQETLSEEIFLDLVHSLASAVDAKDYYDCSHSESVSRYATAIARAMGISGRQLREISIAGLLHDVGKIGIRNSFLSKPGPLNDEEWQKVRQHPSIGGKILKRIVTLGHIVSLVTSHHENYDGIGYPFGMKGSDIPLGARIITVADAYHAMISDRPYRRAKTHGEAIVELRRNAGKQFDPEVIEAFVTALEHDLTANSRGVVASKETVQETVVSEPEIRTNDHHPSNALLSDR